MTSLLILAAVLAVTGLIAWMLRRNDGRLRSVDEDVTDTEQVDLGVDAQRWSFVEFTAPACVPCAEAKRVLDGLAAELGDVDVIDVDVAEHIEAARHHSVMRAPTTLIIAPGGHVVARVGGVPKADDLRAVVRHHAPSV